MSDSSPRISDQVSDESWSIIERSGQDPEKLQQILWTLSKEEIERLDREISIAATQFKYSPYFDILAFEGGYTEDAIADTAECLVWLGRETYKIIEENPALILRYLDDESAPLSGVILEVLESKCEE